MSSKMEKRDNIEIIRGHDTGSCFWIMPVKVAVDDKTAKLDCKRFKQYEISIEEDDVFDYLAYFLFKHFDGDLPENKAREDVDGFDWFLEHNFYTRDAVIKILLDIGNLLEIISYGTDDDLTRLKLAQDYPAKASRGYREINIVHNVYDGHYTLAAVIRFYLEFINYMKEMLTDCKEYNLISFMGP